MHVGSFLGRGAAGFQLVPSVTKYLKMSLNDKTISLKKRKEKQGRVEGYFKVSLWFPPLSGAVCIGLPPYGDQSLHCGGRWPPRIPS